MRNFWKKLLKEFALQDYDHVDIDRTILRIYDRMMTQLEEDWAHLPLTARVDLRYEELVADPIAAVETIYESLALEGFDEAHPRFQAYLSTVKTYKKNRYTYTDEAAELVERNWGRFLEQWSYRRPGSDLLKNSASGAQTT
jgi:LPS sulfotransferase NodH